MTKNPLLNVKSTLKFVFSSLFGIFMFFVQIEIDGVSRIPVDHLIAFLKSLLKNYYVYIIIALIILSLIFKIKKIKEIKKADIFFFVQSVLSLCFTVPFALKFFPEQLNVIANSALDATGNILCAIFLTSFFIPLLTEYGLVDFVAVYFKPVMRRLFKTPGSSAVIGVSAFLGNYSMGHVLSRKMYEDCRFTEKESVIVAVGFSTCSIGLMINLVNYLGLMENWNIYVISILLVTFITTAVTARIPPISKKSDDYKDNDLAQTEEYIKNRLFKEALIKGVTKAENTSGFLSALADILKRVIPIICEITGTSMFVIVLATVLLKYTDVFLWIGYVFLPILKLLGIESAEALTAGTALSTSVLEPVLAGVTCDSANLSLIARWIVSIVPYSSIIFFAGFIPSLYNSKINCKLWEMLLIWIERMILGIFLSALLGYLFIQLGILN